MLKKPILLAEFNNPSSVPGAQLFVLEMRPLVVVSSEKVHLPTSSLQPS